MVIAGGEWQIPIIMKAKQMGLFVINTNLYEDSPGFRYADVGIVADVLDKIRNLEIARQYMPDAIITDQTDIAVPTVAYLCETMGLPGIGTKAAKLFTNKHCMRMLCLERGFPTPLFRLCGSKDEVIRFAKETGYPIVIKPPANQSSRGVHKVLSEADVDSLYPDTLVFSPGGKVLAEEFIAGTEFTVEGFKTPYKAYSLAVSRKSPFAHSEMIASRLLYSRSDPQYDYDSLMDLNERIVTEMGLPFGITHAEYKFRDGRFYLVEIAARGGGTKISSHIIPEMTDLDVNELLIRCALGETLTDIRFERKDQFVVLDFLIFPSGRVASVSGIDWLSSNRSIIDFGLNFRVGDTLYPPTDDRTRHGYFIARAPTRDAIDKICYDVRQVVKVQYE